MTLPPPMDEPVGAFSAPPCSSSFPSSNTPDKLPLPKLLLFSLFPMLNPLPVRGKDTGPPFIATAFLFFAPSFGDSFGIEPDDEFVVVELLLLLLLAADACEREGLLLELAWEKSFHLRQPSKSIKACMQPHSMTLRSSQTKFTGCVEERNKTQISLARIHVRG